MDTVWNNLSCVQRLIHNLGELLISAKVLVVEFGITGWVNAAEIGHTVELGHRLRNQVAEFESSTIL